MDGGKGGEGHHDNDIISHGAIGVETHTDRQDTKLQVTVQLFSAVLCIPGW